MNQDTIDRTDHVVSPPLGTTPPPATTPSQGQSPPSGIDEVKRVAVEKAHETADEIKHGATEALGSAKRASNDFIQDQKNRLADLLDEYTHAVKAASDSLEGENHNPLVGPANRASRQLERTSEYLRNCEPMDILHDLGDFAKRRPEIVFGGMFLAGMAAVRFLKASSRDRHLSQNRYGGGSDLALRDYDVPRYGTPGQEPFTPTGPSTPGTNIPSSSPAMGGSSDAGHSEIMGSSNPGISPTFNPTSNPPAQS